MTAAAGYIRAKTSRPRSIDRAWEALQLATLHLQPITRADIMAQAGVSKGVIDRLLSAAVAAGWATYTMEQAPGVPQAVRHYVLTETAPATAPSLRLGDGGSAMPVGSGDRDGDDLRRLMAVRNWTLTQAAEALGIADRRTVRRYLTAPVLPTPVADRIKVLEAQP